MKRQNIEFMIGWLDALRRDDVTSLGETLHPQIVWQGLREDLVCHGPGEVVEVFVQQRDAYAELDALELIGAERGAIMHANGGDFREVAGIPLPDGIYNFFTIENGKVARIDDFADRGQALAAAGLGAASG
jgi:hypothetical protein